MANRHICVPKQTLLRFSNKGNLNYFNLENLDLKNKVISDATPDDFLTQQDYYLLEAEKILSDKIETEMGRLYKKTDDALKTKQIIPKTIRKLHEIAKKIIAVQSLRNPDYTRKHTLPHFKKLSGEYKGRIGARKLANDILKDDKYESYLNEYYSAYNFDLYRSMILKNCTDRDFFLTTTNYYRCLSNEGKERFIIPMCPKVAWVLIDEEEYNREYKIDGAECIGESKEIETIKTMNYFAYKFESEYGSKKIVSTREELEKFDFEEYNDFCNLLFAK